MCPRTYYFDRVSSTMDVLHQLAVEGAVPGTAVVAGEQIQGRGSRGRPWYSPVGGLWLSLLFRPPTAGGIEITSIRAGLAAAEVLDSLLPEPMGLKWPNDLMFDGRKIGGVLCEARWQGDNLAWIAVGIGMNVLNTVPDELGSIATSLARHVRGISPEAIAPKLIAALRQLDLAPAQLSRTELEQFAVRDWLRGRRVRSPLHGTVIGLCDDGALLVRTDEGPSASIRSGPIELAVAAPSR
jgi:BirA family biotin operon repressor/biotin-[acetyl-CoA-carboxylase] ligase